MLAASWLFNDYAKLRSIAQSMPTIIGLCTIELYIPGTQSLKDKRAVLKSMLKKLHNTFNVSASEVDKHDVWQSSVIAVALVCNETKHAHRVIGQVVEWIERHYPDVNITKDTIEII